ncbi:MAG: HD domain-containing protein [Eubacteriales bacterium]|nr:HD domain-containing protein [Eubacteriales bacterium]
MIALPDAPARAIERLEAAGYESWVVGGCVRDSLRGAQPHDWDLCTAARPDEMRAVFAGERLLETGVQHGTLTLLTADGPLEITTFRADGAYADGRHPDGVRFVGSIEDDLARRDLTVGAMAWHPQRGLCDPYGGLDDLQEGVLRAVGDPDARFREDALRILRTVRFVSQLGFAVEPATAAAMRRQVARLDCVAAERVCTELTGTLCGRFARRALLGLADVLGYVLPELAPMIGCDQRNRHHRYTVWEHSVRAVEQVPAEPALRWAALLHDCGKPACKTIDEQGVGHFYGHPKAGRAIADELLRRLRFSGADRDRILLLVEQHDRPLGDTAQLVRRRLSAIGEARFRDLLALKKGDAVGQGTHPEAIAALQAIEQQLNDVLAAQACFSLRQLAVDGDDLTALGLSGPAVGEMLRALLDATIDGQVDNTRTALLALVRARMEGTI